MLYRPETLKKTLESIFFTIATIEMDDPKKTDSGVSETYQKAFEDYQAIYINLRQRQRVYERFGGYDDVFRLAEDVADLLEYE